MKILRLQAYCFPERMASAHLICDLYEACAAEKIETVVYTPTPTRGIDQATRDKYKKIKYEEQYNGYVVIHRFAMFREGNNPLQRAFRYILCNIAQYWMGVHEKNANIVFGASTPPTQGILCALTAKRLSKKYKRNIPFVYNLQDIFPDSLVTSGLTQKGSFLWKIGRKIENYTYKNADKIIVISENMKRNIINKGVPEDKIIVIPNWIDTETVKPIKKDDNRLYAEFHISKEKFTVLYAGNFGAAQGADIILKAAETLMSEPDIQFVIFGGGAEFHAAAAYVKEHHLTNVIIQPLLPQDRVSEVYSLGDVALITCKSGVGSSGMPSKTWSIMACNTPIIASFDTDSDMACILQKSGAGICVEPENVSELSKAILEASKNRRKQNSLQLTSYVERTASKTVCVQKYIDVLKSAVSQK